MARKKPNFNNKRGPIRTALNNAARSIVHKGAQAAIPGLSKLVTAAVAKAVPKLIGAAGAAAGIPFQTSGMMASATPMSIGSGISVSAPSANGKISRTGGPRMRSKNNGNTVIRHREYVADIAVEEAGFDLQYSFGVNPGNHALFPWLSQIATRYETYSIKSLQVIFEPQCGTSSTGTLMLAIDYDSSDSPPTSKSQMMSYKNAVRAPLWFAASHISASADLHRLKTNYVLSGVAPEGTDIKTYDVGNLFVAVQSDGASQTAGELYVEYEVELMTPQINYDPPSATVLSAGGSTSFEPLMSTTPIYGPLPIRVQPVTAGEQSTTSVFVGQAGFYQGMITFTGGTTDTINGDLQALQTETYPGWVFKVTNQTSPATQQIQWMFNFQVQNPESAAFQFEIASEIPWENCLLQISQVSQSALVVFQGSAIVVNPTTRNPRARLGRINPYPVS